MSAEKLGYAQVAAATTTIKSGPSGFFGLTCVVAGAVTVYDNTAASGTILYTKTLAVGDVVNFGTFGYAAKNGLTVVAAGTVNIQYT